MLLDDTMGIILAFVNQLVFVFVQVHMYVHVEVRGQPWAITVPQELATLFYETVSGWPGIYWLG